MISLLFLTYNRRGIAARCFCSLAPTLHRSDVEWVILDNASTDGTADWLLKMAGRYSNIHLELSAKNHGVAGGRKRLLELAQGDNLVFLDSDIEARNSNWLDTLLAPLSNPAIGITGAAGHRLNERWQPIRVAPDYNGKVDVLSGYCQAFRRDVLDRGVVIDTSFNHGGAEDDDFCLQIASKGLEVWQVTNIGIHHIFSGTWNTALYPQMRARLKAKWSAVYAF
ncbi:MAG: glycosyltransferase [Anaerolineae bacterium]|nr:glycosyltransferase [Anaerolineae bacterium]